MLLGDGEGDYTDKYCPKVTVISKGIPCVWLTNVDLRERFGGEEWRDQVIFENLEEKLY